MSKLTIINAYGVVEPSVAGVSGLHDCSGAEMIINIPSNIDDFIGIKFTDVGQCHLDGESVDEGWVVFEVVSGDVVFKKRDELTTNITHNRIRYSGGDFTKTYNESLKVVSNGGGVIKVTLQTPMGCDSSGYGCAGVDCLDWDNPSVERNYTTSATIGLKIGNNELPQTLTHEVKYWCSGGIAGI